MQHYIEANLEKLWSMRPRESKGYASGLTPGASPNKKMIGYGEVRRYRTLEIELKPFDELT